MDTVIIHGKRVTQKSPRAGRDAALWGVTRANVKFWGESLTDWTEWFDMHPLVATHQFDGIAARRPEAWRWYAKQGTARPIWLQAPEDHAREHWAEAERRFKEIPGAQPFPLKAIQRALPINGEPNRWFTCQVDMMLAKAIVDGYRTVILNGIGVASQITYQHLHRGIPYWIGFARGHGVDVVVEGPSTYHTPQKVYAYERLSYDELAQGRKEERDLERFGGDLATMEEINDRERRRGRPLRFTERSWTPR